jgi:tryptophan halogenase
VINVNKVVIVGGGSSGWITATTLIKFYPNMNLTLIESDSIEKIGVGESTQASITSWMNMLGIDKEEMLRETDGSYKLGIKFNNFYKTNDLGFFYPFGKGSFDKYYHELDPVAIWNFKKQMYSNTDIQDYCNSFFPQMNCIYENKIPNEQLESFDIDQDVAFHFDAIKFASYLKNKICIPDGVNHLVDTISRVKVGDNGVEFLELSSGQKVYADLFIDCSGFKALLIGESLGEEYESFEEVLPVNRAWAVQIPYKNKKIEMLNYTDSTALSSGWVWAAPLWSRIGTGYVYSDKFISPEDALSEFKDYLIKVRGDDRGIESMSFRDISFKSGMRNRCWVKNVVAIGLSAGFIEPLESNGLHTTYELALKLIKVINRGFVNQWDIDSFNYMSKHTIVGFKEFVQSHYFLSTRDDSEFWKYMTSISPVGDVFDSRIDQTTLKSLTFNKLNPFGTFSHEKNTGWHCIAAGMEYSSVGPDSLRLYQSYLEHDINDIVNDFISSNIKDRITWKAVSKESLSHEDTLLRIHNV